MERKCIVAETGAAAQSKGSYRGRGRYGMIPFDDRQLVRKHGGLGLQDYWLDCWEADPYGSRYILMPDADLKNTTHRKYRRQLKELNLFMFETKLSGKKYQLWVLNLHGVRRDNWLHLKGYKRFLKSDYWKQVRTAVLERDGRQCQQCGAKTNLHAHHLSYKHHRDEINHLGDLVTLCENCHAQVHDL